VPAGPGRVPEIAPGDQRWFVHHTKAAILGEIEQVGWNLSSVAVRSSHRDWLQVIARRPS